MLQFHAEVCYERACYSFMPKCVMSGTSSFGMIPNPVDPVLS